MKKFAKRSLSLLLALIMCLSLLAGIPLPEAQAANYVANWGVRGEEATELSATATKFYQTAGVTYSGLSSLSGSSTLNSVPSSALYLQLQNIMQTYHTYETDYDETRDLYKYTDCQNSDTSYITCIYCGEQYQGAWPSGGDPWNREHTWPKSKSLDGNDPNVDQVDEEDIMLLRPACMGENSSRSNKAYGSTTNDTYFYPNIDKGNGTDARGDLARTMLYVYVRYGNSGYMWGSSGVIESKELLLSWMEADPVDTWEMGRNDAVQAITGTRNVFIDYPELAFKLFNTAVPSDYQTPSGGVDCGSGEAVTVSFMEDGAVTSTISTTSGSAFTFPVAKNTAPSGYSFVGWVAETVSETTVRPSNIYNPGGAALAGSQTYYALYSQTDDTQQSTDYVLHTGAITEGDYLFVAAGGAMSTAANGSALRRDAIPVTVTDNTVYSPDAALIWHIAPTSDGYYTFYNSTIGQYAAANGTKNQLITQSSVTDYAKWNISNGVITNKGNLAKGVNYTLRRNDNYGFACYAPSTGAQPILYKAAAGAVTYTTSVHGASCQHTNSYVSGKVDATCTASGYTGDTYCASCNVLLNTGSVIAQLEHSFANGVCTGCGMAQPRDPVYTLVTAENITAGNYVIGAVRDGTYPDVYLATSTCKDKWSVTSSTTIATDGMITELPTGTQVFTLTGDQTNGFTIGYHNGTQMVYLGYTSADTNKLAFNAGYTNKWKIKSFNDGVLLTDGTYNVFQNSTAVDAIRGYTKTYSSGKGLYLFKEMLPVAEPSVELTHISLNPGKDALGYKAAATNLPEGATVQISLWVNEDKIITKSATALHLVNILAHNGGETVIYAKATIVDSEGQVIAQSAIAQTTLQEAMEAVNENWSSYTDIQKTAVMNYVNSFITKIPADWHLDTIYDAIDEMQTP